MNDKSKLLNDLRIDRGDETEIASRPRWLIGIALFLGLAAAGAAATWWTVGDPRAVRVNAATAVAVDLGGADAPRRGEASTLDASGYVVARRQATVSAKITGRVVEMLIEEGQTVSAGEIIARLDAANAVAALRQAEAQHGQAEAELAAARIALNDARPIFERNEQQFAAAVISEQGFDEAKASFNALEASLAVRERAVAVTEASIALAKRNHEDTIVRAPFDGVITVKAAQAGEIVSPVTGGGGFTRTGIGTIVDMSSLEVEVDVSESFINRVRPAQPARVRLNAYPDWEIPAEVVAVVPTADRARATVKVRVGFREKDERVLPEMGARVSFLSVPSDAQPVSERPSRRGVLVPADSVIVDGSSGVVFVIEDGAVERRIVELGARRPDGQLVLDGLSPGARIARGNLEQLADGASVRVSD